MDRNQTHSHISDVPALARSSLRAVAHLWERTVVPRVDHVLAELYSLHVLDLRCFLVRRVVMIAMIAVSVLLLSLFAALQAKHDLSCTERARYDAQP